MAKNKKQKTEKQSGLLKGYLLLQLKAVTTSLGLNSHCLDSPELSLGPYIKFQTEERLNEHWNSNMEMKQETGSKWGEGRLAQEGAESSVNNNQ